MDDDEDDRFLICAALAEVDAGINIAQAHDGLHFLELVGQAGSPVAVLILLDMNMPRMNGLETVRKIKSNPILSEVPIVMISTTDNESLTSQAYQLGVSSFYTKPNSFEGFIDLAKTVVSEYL